MLSVDVMLCVLYSFSAVFDVMKFVLHNFVLSDGVKQMVLHTISAVC